MFISVKSFKNVDIKSAIFVQMDDPSTTVNPFYETKKWMQFSAK